MYPKSWVAAGLIVTFFAMNSGRAVDAQRTLPERVEEALELAGPNRAELEKLLAVYQDADDDLKFRAACFLIENMPGHAYVETGLFDQSGNEISFDVLQYKSLGEAQQAKRELEEEHGPLEFNRTIVKYDIEIVSADYLIENIESAFRTWKTKPWTKSMTFETFCEYILPYRATSEPVEPWRDACEIDTDRVLAKIKNRSKSRDAAAMVGDLTSHRVYFNELYYMHPTDQGFTQLCDKPIGRCEDQQTMQTYVMRANGIPVAGDYTPHWANRDNNHAWGVLLDETGRGSAGLSYRAAKVYRKMYSHNLENLFFKNEGKEKLPRWLAGRSFRDVTDQYMPTTDVTIQLTEPSPKPTQFAYICVFNGGQWKPIHWCSIDGNKAVFANMGRNVVYLVGYFVDDKIVPAAPPFILDKNRGTIRLAVVYDRVHEWQQRTAEAENNDDDLDAQLVEENSSADPIYEIMVWQNGWQVLENHVLDPKESESVGRLPDGGLYWIVSDTNRQTARPFTIKNGKPRYW